MTLLEGPAPRGWVQSVMLGPIGGGGSWSNFRRDPHREDGCSRSCWAPVGGALELLLEGPPGVTSDMDIHEINE